MTRPSCYGNFNMALGSPCRRCALSNRCAYRTDTGKFTIMASARFTDVVRDTDNLAKAVQAESVTDAQLVDAIDALCARKKFTVRKRGGGRVILTKSGAIVAYVKPYVGNMVMLLVPLVPVKELRELPQSRRCFVGVWRDPGVKKSDTQSQWLSVNGSLVVASTKDDAEAMLLAIYREFNK